MNAEKLIQLVSEHELLFNFNDKDYHDTHKKIAVWKEIGKKLNQTDKSCKRHWTLLRDNLQRTLRRRKTNLQPGGFQRKWKHEEKMSFLKPYLKDRSWTVRNGYHSSTEETEHVVHDVPSIQSDDDTVKQSINRNKEKVTLVQIADQQDDVDTLFRSLAQTVKKMDPYYRALSKARVFSVVSELELENLTPHSCLSISTQVPSPTNDEYTF